MTTTAQFVAYLQSLGVELRPAGDHLDYRAPATGLPAGVFDELRERRAEVVNFLWESTGRDEPVSLAEEGLWLTQTLHEDSKAYNVTGAVQLAGELDVDLLSAAMVAVADRHETLRSVFLPSAGRPRRLVRAVDPGILTFVDLSDMDEQDRRRAVCTEIDAAVDHRFDLAHGPLLRPRLLRTGPRSHVLIFSAHHIVGDGWSMDLLYRELSSAYRQLAAQGRAELPELSTHYTEYARRQREQLESGAFAASERYWAAQLAGLPAELSLRPVAPRAVTQSFVGQTSKFTVDGAAVTRIRELAQRAGTTLFTALLTVYGLTLYSLSKQSTFAVGLVAANREDPELAGVVGMIATLLPLRFDIDSEQSFAGVLRRSHDRVLDARQHQDYPFECIVGAYTGERARGVPAVVQVLYDLEYRQDAGIDLPGVTVTPIQVPVRTAKFDLSLIVRDDGDRLEHTIEFDALLFDQAWATTFAEHYRAVLDAVVDDPGEPVGRVLPGMSAGPDAGGQLVLRLCAELLGVPEVSPSDDFFALGGTSLLAVRLVFRLHEETGVVVSAAEVLRCSRLGDLATTVADLITTQGSAHMAGRI